MITQTQVNRYSRMIFFILVIPVLLTILFSKLVTSKDIFRSSLAFSVKEPYAKFLGINCILDNCTSTIANPDKIKIYKNLAEMISFTSERENLTDLESVKANVDSGIEKYLNLSTCEKDPGAFTAELLLRNTESEFIFGETNKTLLGLYEVLALTNTHPQITTKYKAGVCRRLSTLLRGYFISDIENTYEQQVAKLKLVMGFYFFITLIGVMIFYVLPEYRRRL